LIFLVDASVYVFRAYHSVLPDMRDRDGQPVHAVFGFARFLGDLIERVRPKYIAVAFDQRRADSYRSRIYPPYKANRERAPADLVLQFERCRQLCRHLGIAMFVDPEYEADDIIGSLAALMRTEGVRSAYITRDKDLAQLMHDGDVFWDFGAREQFGYHDIERHFGVLPERFADYLALTGDDVDNIPGCPASVTAPLPPSGRPSGHWMRCTAISGASHSSNCAAREPWHRSSPSIATRCFSAGA
jgi:5'-3' exonuclease